MTLLESPPTLVLLQGDEAECAQWQRALEARYRPDVLAFNLGGPRDVPEALRKGSVGAGAAVAFVCRDMTCLPAITALDTLLERLTSTGGAAAR